MRESELRQIFLRIANRYSHFAYDDFKVHDWLELLKDVPFELAMGNLRRYSLNPENRFPPHPGALAEQPTAQAESRDIPNADETRVMLAQREKLLLAGGPAAIPEHVYERMKQLGYKSATSSGRN